MDTLGEKIYRQRKKCGFSQDELSSLIGVTRQTISKWETDVMQPTFDNILLLCDALGVSIEYFSNESAVSKEAKEESAICGTTGSLNETKNKKKIQTVFIIGIILTSILLLIAIMITVVMGLASLTSNNGDYEVIISSDIHKEYFFVMLFITIALIITDVVLICVMLRKKRKCNEKLTKCKE